MRLYLNPKEVTLIKDCLVYQSNYLSGESKEMMKTILERMELCEQLQKNERRSKNYVNK